MKQNKGITLVALIITIIVMIILAGVTISLTVGDNGIFSKAKRGGSLYTNAQDEERVALNSFEEQMDQDKNFEESRNYNNPVVPEGFKKVDTESAKWDYKNGNIVEDWNKGLVIEDEINGNQFVWVPVKDGVADNGAYESNDSSTVQFKKWCVDGYSYDLTTDNSLPSEIDELTQINIYGGFYISRYITNFQNDSDRTGKIVSREGVSTGVKNYGANNYKKYSEEMYCNNYVQSSLITGRQWDTLIRWLICTGIDVESKSIGSFSGYNNTGSNPKVNNIYDLTGCVRTVTNELYNESAVIRGAYYVEQQTFVKTRRTGISGWGYGSRTVLNIK